MYNTFFGFREKPFNLVPNPDYLFLSKSHEIALAHLTYAMDQGEGFAVITGEVGTGKTTLCRKFLEGLNDQTESAYIFNPRLESEQLLGAICHEFGIDTKETNTKAFLDLLNDYLIKKNAEHHKVVLLIDEAQGLSTENLELVRMLSNLETTRSKLLQIVLVGQPELEDKLESHELRQLAQRISLSYRLAPLSAKDSQAYIQHRLWIAAQRQTDLFTTDACRLAFRFSRGIPRLINIVCDRALLTAYSHNRPKVTKRVMHTAIMEIISRGKTNQGYKRWPLILGVGVCLLALVLVAAVLITRTDFRLKLNFGESKPASSEVEAPATSIAKTFKIPGTDKSKTISADPLTGAGQASMAADIPGNGVPLKPEYLQGGQPPKVSSIAASESASASVLPSSTDQPAPVPDAGIPAQSGQTLFGELINRLEPGSSRKKATSILLSIWQQPRPNVDIIPAEIDDASFFKIAARQYGLRNYTVQDNWALIRQLDLPAIVALKKGMSGHPVFLTLVGWREQSLYFEAGRNGAAVQFDFETVRPYLEGPVYVFWKNVFGYDMIIGYGADSRAISAVKGLLQQIGYDQIAASSEFDTSTRAAVLDFQRRHSLSVDGLVGTLTKIMLLQEAGTINLPTLSVNNRPPS
jgi:general secretion pathway protein A